MNIAPRYSIGKRVTAYDSDVFPFPITGEITKIDTSIAVKRGLPTYNRYKINGRWFFEIDIAREEEDFINKLRELGKKLKSDIEDEVWFTFFRTLISSIIFPPKKNC